MHIAGVDIGGKSIKIGIFDENMKLIHRDSVVTPINQPERAADLIADMIAGHEVGLVGVGTAGSVDRRTDVVSASNLGWDQVPLLRLLSERIQKPVYLDNDAQAALMAEWYDGACQGVECAVYLTLGTGIGGALILDGKPWRGRNNLAAEFGHISTHADGLLCACGRRGCFERYGSASALERMSGGQTAREVTEAAKAGDPDALHIFTRYVRELCVGMNSLIMAFDPDVIVLGGGVSGAGDFLRDLCMQELRHQFAATHDPLYCDVKIAHHQNDAGILGAALLGKLRHEK